MGGGVLNCNEKITRIDPILRCAIAINKEYFHLSVFLLGLEEAEGGGKFPG